MYSSTDTFCCAFRLCAHVGGHMDDQPTRMTKVFFWILIGSLSTFFAEVVSGSDMFPFFHVWGLAVVFPLYTLHMLVLATIVSLKGVMRLPSLFWAGALFGLYEAYITKVLWDPPWGPTLNIAGVAPIEIVILVLWWHPLMAFILPLTLGESVLTSSHETLDHLPKRIYHWLTRKRTYVLFAIAAGLLQSINSASPFHSLASGVMTTGTLIGLIFIWREKIHGYRFRLRDLLPNEKELRVLVVLLAFIYIILTPLLRPESLPTIVPQAIILSLYVIFTICLVRSLQHKEPTENAQYQVTPIQLPYRWWILLAGVFMISSFIGSLFNPYNQIFAILGWLVGGGIGFSLLIYSLRHTRSEPKNSSMSTIK